MRKFYIIRLSDKCRRGIGKMTYHLEGGKNIEKKREKVVA